MTINPATVSSLNSMHYVDATDIGKKPATTATASDQTSAPVTKDQATISKAGIHALDTDAKSAPSTPGATPIATPAAAAAHDAPDTNSKVLTSGEALQLGVSLSRSNPAAFKSADSNGDGRLSVAEAKAAGFKV